MKESKTLNFNGHDIPIAIHPENNKEYIPVRPLANAYGLNKTHHVSKVKNDLRFNVDTIPVYIKNQGNKQKYIMACIPIDQIELWKSTIWMMNPKSKRYTYIIWDGKSDFVKIGISSNPLQRLKNFQIGHKSLQIIYLMEGDYESYFEEKWNH